MHFWVAMSGGSLTKEIGYYRMRNFSRLISSGLMFMLKRLCKTALKTASIQY